MGNLLALAAELQQLNETLEAGARLDQMVVTVEWWASEAEIATAVAAQCAHCSVKLENVAQVVIVKRAPCEGDIEDAVVIVAVDGAAPPKSRCHADSTDIGSICPTAYSAHVWLK